MNEYIEISKRGERGNFQKKKKKEKEKERKKFLKKKKKKKNIRQNRVI